MRRFIICIFAIYYLDVQMEEDEIGVACSAHEEIRNTYRMSVGEPERKDNSEDLILGERIMSKRVSEKQGFWL